MKVTSVSDTNGLRFHTIRTFELFIQPPSGGDGECADELLEVDSAVLVLVEDVEDIIREFTWIAEGEELLIDPTEFGLIELAGGTVLQEALVPVITHLEPLGGRLSVSRDGQRTIAAALAYQLKRSCQEDGYVDR
jgi:hypothetical protein